MRAGARGTTRAWLVVALAACASGSGQRLRPGPIPSTLGGDAVARVGQDVLPASLVGQAAERLGVSPREALARLVDDSVAALGAEDQGLARDPVVAEEIVAARARQMVVRIQQSSLAKGPPTDDEVAEITRERWKDFDLPEGMVVIHAVVVRPKPVDSAKDAQAKTVAAAIAATEASATDAADFEARAKAVAHGTLEVRVERLEPFVADGRILTKSGTYDPAFAAAAAALAAPNMTSGVVASPFGWHVIRLLEKLPGKHVPLEERRKVFAEEIQTRRADRALRATIASLRANTTVDMPSGVDDLLTLAFQKGTTPPGEGHDPSEGSDTPKPSEP